MNLNAKDIIKNGILEQLPESLSAGRVIFSLLVSFAIALFILFIYRKTFSGVLYSRSFASSIVMVTVITTLIILPITSNIMLSLGMVGALSIVRFRTAVKDSMDTMFLFWGIAVGICMGANFWAIAIIGSLIIGVIAVLLTLFRHKTSMPYLLVIHFDEESTPEVQRAVERLPKHKLKSKVLRNSSVELTLEVRLAEGEDKAIDTLQKIGGVYDASLLSYQGDLIS